MKFNKRDGNEGEIVRALTKAGVSVDYALRRPYDLICGRGGITYLLEVKEKKGKLKQSQIDFQQEWLGHYAIVRDAEQALRAVGL